MKNLILSTWILAICFLAPRLFSQDQSSASAAQPESNSDSSQVDTSYENPFYHLAIGDTISITVAGEPDASTLDTIDPNGLLRLQFIDTPQNLVGKTRREAEEYLQQLYFDEEIFVKPIVKVQVTKYSQKIVMLQGEFNRSTFIFPPEVESMELTELISLSGGFTQLANQRRVDLIRKGESHDQRRTINVKEILQGKSIEVIIIHPGDRLIAYQVIL